MKQETRTGGSMFPRSCTLVLFSTLALACGGAQTPPASSAAQQKSEDPASSLVVTEALGHPHIGEAAPDFELPDQQGNLVKLSSLRGSIVVLALVASWCPFSKAEQPHLKTLAEGILPRGVKTIAVVIADTEEGFAKYNERLPMGFPVLRDVGDVVGLGYSPEHAHPSFKDRRKVEVSANVVIDPQGVIRYFTLGDTKNFDAEMVQVRAAVDGLLAQGG
ncbi:MAG: peroxiredoxin family protein [Polyangiales bacterium]